MPTALIGAAIGGGLSLLGSSKAADAQKEAAAQQAQATREALALQKQIYEKNTANAQPYMTAGTNALNMYGDALGLNGSGAQQNYYNNFQTDPGYNNVLRAGTDAISNSAAARGTLYGGNTLKAVNDYGGGMLQNAYNTRLGQIKGVSDQGLTATNALAGVGTSMANASGIIGTNAANNGSNSLANAGYYQGAGIIGAGNSLINAFNSYNNKNAYSSGATGGGYDPSWSNTFTSNGW